MAKFYVKHTYTTRIEELWTVEADNAKEAEAMVLEAVGECRANTYQEDRAGKVRFSERLEELPWREGDPTLDTIEALPEA